MGKFKINTNFVIAGLSNSAIAIIACLSWFVKSITTAFTLNSWNLYAASGIGIFSAAIVPVLRKITAESVPKNDTGIIVLFLFIN